MLLMLALTFLNIYYSNAQQVYPQPILEFELAVMPTVGPMNSPHWNMRAT